MSKPMTNEEIDSLINNMNAKKNPVPPPQIIVNIIMTMVLLLALLCLVFLVVLLIKGIFWLL